MGKKSSLLRCKYIAILTICCVIIASVIKNGEAVIPYGVKAATPIKAGCSGVRRNNPNSATAWLYSDTAGTIYYYVDAFDGASTLLTKQQIIDDGHGTAAVADSITEINVDYRLTSGKQYVHMVVVDSEDADNISDIVTAEMPIDYMYFESFEAYHAGYGYGSAGWRDLDQDRRIVSDSGNFCLDVYNNSTAFIPVTNGGDTVIIETKVKFEASIPNMSVGPANVNRWNEFQGYPFGFAVRNGEWKGIINDVTYLDLDQAPEVTSGVWHTVRVVYNYTKNDFDIYIDYQKANSVPLKGNSNKGISRIYFNSSSGQNTFFDDIGFWSYPTNSNLIKDSIVNFDLKTANYVSNQTISLSTRAEGKTIYYTTDGSYPEPNSGSATTKLYDPDTKITIGYDTDDDGDGDHVTTIRAIAGTETGSGFNADAVTYSETYSFEDSVHITDAGLYRNGDNSVYASLYSNVSGDVYYMIKDSDAVPTADDIYQPGNKSNLSVQQNTTGQLYINSGINKGPKEIYVLVADKDGNKSNVIKLDYPVDACIFDNFEEYPEGATSGNVTIFGFGGSTTAETIDGDKAFKMINSVSTGVLRVNAKGRLAVMEGNLNVNKDSASFEFGLRGWGSSYDSYRAVVVVENGVWKWRSQNKSGVLDLMTGETMASNTWYNVRIVCDNTLSKFDVYINNKKANSEPLDAYLHGTTSLWIDNQNGQNLYLDELKYYCPVSDSQDYITYDPAARTFTTDQNIKISFSTRGKVIHYTLDGSYPDTEIGGSTLLYNETDGIDLSGENKTIRSIAGIIEDGVFKPETIAMDSTYTYLPPGPEIKGGSINKYSPTEAFAWFFCNAQGTAYYAVNDTEAPLGYDGIKEISDTNSSTEYSVAENKVTSIKMNKGLSQGVRYAHIIVKDREGNLSNELIIPILKENNFRYDNFEEFPDGTNYRDDNNYNNKANYSIIPYDSNHRNVIDPTDSTNNAYAISIFNNNSYDRIHTGDYLGYDQNNSTHIMEARIMTEELEPTVYLADGLRWNAGICLQNGEWKSLVGTQEYSTDSATIDDFDNADKLPVYKPNNWYTIRIVNDRNKKQFDVYINGIKANDAPIKTTNANNYDIMAGAQSGSTLYIDDIVYYTLPYENVNGFSRKDAIVKISPTTRTYTSDLEVTLNTFGYKKIYYSDEGSYPNPTASGNGKTKEFSSDTPIAISGKTTTVRAIAGIMENGKFKAESIPYEEKYTYLNEGPKIYGQSILRNSDTQAYTWFYSDSAGKAYYYINDSADPVGDAFIESYVTENNYSTFDVLEGKVTSIRMTNGMKYGKCYAHVVVKDKENNYSNELIYEMPYNRYRYDDFEEFPNLAGSNIGDYYNNKSSNNRLLIYYNADGRNMLDPTDASGKNNVYAITGNHSNVINGDNGDGIGYYDRETVIIEGKMMSELSAPTAYFAFGYRWNVGVAIVNGKWKSIVGKDTNVLNSVMADFENDSSLPVYSANKWYTLRIVYDNYRKIFDVYINNIKANDEPIKAYLDWNNHISLGSEGTTTAYFDDIICYAMNNDNKDMNSNVTYTPEAAIYTTSKQIKLNTGFDNRDIYYTVDGSYPNPTASGNSNTVKFGKNIDISETTTFHALSGIVEDGVFKAECVATEAVYTINKAPIIKGGGVYRSSASNATIWLKSNMAGDVYYKASESSTPPECSEETLNEKWNKANSKIKAETTMKINVSNDMSITSKYIYVVVRDDDGVFSNILTYNMPYEYYLFNDFEAATHNGEEMMGSWVNYTANELVPETDNMAYAYRYGAQDMYSVPNVSTGNTIVFEADVMSNYDNATLGIGCGNDYQAVVYTESGKWYAYYGGNNKTELDNTAEKGFKKNTWYHIRIEYSIKKTEREQNVYIDGELANSSPIKCISTSNKNRITMIGVSYSNAQSQSAYFDNIKWYVDQSKIATTDMPNAARNLVYNGNEQVGITYNNSGMAYKLLSVSDGSVVDEENGKISASKAGTYSASFELNEGYMWSDGTKVSPKTIFWKIDRKPVEVIVTTTKAYDGNDNAEIDAKNVSIQGILSNEKETVNLVLKKKGETDPPEKLLGYYEDEYSGTGKTVTLDREYSFALSDIEEGSGASKNYTIIKETITSNITPASQKVEKARSLQAGVGDVLDKNRLGTAVKGAKGTLSYEITEGGDYATYNAETGVTIKDNAAGQTIKVKATAAAVDLGGDETPEYSADTEGTVFEIKVTNKDNQIVLFPRNKLSIAYGKTGAGYEAEVVVEVGDGGEVTYTSDNTDVVTVDSATGKLTTVSLGTANITAIAASNARYNEASATYEVTVTKGTVAKPYVEKTDESLKNRNDGCLIGLDNTMEYMIEGETVYTKITDEMLEDGGTIKGLAPGIYYVRYFETDEYYASKDTKVVIEAGPEPTPEPTATPTVDPTATPTLEPTATPTLEPTATPTVEPTSEPTTEPTATATVKPTPIPDPAEELKDTVPEAENVPVEKKEETIKKSNTDTKDIAGSTQKYLMLKAVPKGKTSVKLTWKSIKGVTGYRLYGAKCGNKMEYIMTLENPSAKNYTVKGLKKGTYYKYMVVAYKMTSAGERVVTTSKSVHVVTDGGSKGNPTSLKVKKTKVSLKKGKTAKIKASFKKKKKVATHIAKFRYESVNPAIATVDKSGKIKAVNKGKTKIYVYTQNGIVKTVTVTVK